MWSDKVLFFFIGKDIYNKQNIACILNTVSPCGLEEVTRGLFSLIILTHYIV